MRTRTCGWWTWFKCLLGVRTWQAQRCSGCWPALRPFARHTAGCASRRTPAGACDCGLAGVRGETAP